MQNRGRSRGFVSGSNLSVARSPACKAALQSRALRLAPANGGADRDRTDDLKLAKLALSQLSYGPGWGHRQAALAGTAWWARDELNVRPHAYQACALTT
jgi:hypothetical protein